MPKIVDHDARRREIAATVARLIAEQMLENVTIQGIARACGYSPGMVLHYYANKEQLLLSALGWCESQHRARIEKQVAGRRGVQALYHRLLAALPTDATIAREWHISMQFWSHLPGSPAIAEYYNNRHWESFSAGIEDLELGTALNELQTGLDLEWTMRSLTTLVTGIGVSALYNAGQYPAATQRRMLKQAIEPLARVALED
ncbi:MAG TPA: TetR/AcrR family transcriptional regulator [Spongiibacteraceae bacterium]|jgi:AcrR family transcriptional regulator|nr:TetR/AcrR family transcriptional regulator [Spongiibacteraceae bacterium]HUH38744.1 TetR/AcrR family transcriptional regulator [Spongiibacteraceae bacterium]